MSDKRPSKKDPPNNRWGAPFLRSVAILLGIVAAILLILALYFALRPRPVRVVERPVPVTLTPTPLPQGVPFCPTTAPTVTRTPTSIFATQTPDPPAATLPPAIARPLPTGTAVGRGGGPGEQAVCQRGGVAWHDPNRADGSLYGERTLGESNENCWIVGQIWTDNGEGVAEVWVFALRPGATVTFAGYRGGTAWFFGGDEAAALANLDQQVAELGARDPEARITRLILPDEASRWRLVVRTSSR